MGQSHLEIHRPLPGDSDTTLSVVGRAHVLWEMGAGDPVVPSLLTADRMCPENLSAGDLLI